MEPSISRRRFLLASSAAPTALGLAAVGTRCLDAGQTGPFPQKPEQFCRSKLIELDQLVPQGELALRLHKSVEHLELIPRDRLVGDLANPDRPWSYGADFAGRWLEVLSVAARLPGYRGRQFGVREVLQALCRFQRPDGMLGKREDSTGWSCAGRGLMGLVETYATFKYPEALEAAGKLVGYFDTNFPKRPTQRGCMGLRDLVRYAEVTGDGRGFTIARRIYDTCHEIGPDWPFEKVFGNLHVYINIHRGLVDLYRNTGDKEVLQQAVTLQRWLLKENLVWVSGGINEWLDPPKRNDPAVAGNEDANFFKDVAPLARIRDETCTTADWMLLNLELARATSEDHYTEAAEQAFWNHFLFGQAANGGWCGHRDLSGMAGDVWDFCCSHHGPRCLIEAVRHALVPCDGGLRLNLHVPVTASLKWPQGKATATVQFDPKQPRYAILFGPETAGTFAVRLRRPPWTRDLRVEAPAKQVADPPGEDVVVSGTWKPGDRIVCSYKPAVVIHADRTPPVDRSAIQRGPLMLAAVNAPARQAGGANVTCEKTADSRRIAVDLAGRFVGLKGLFWVPPHLVDWDHPDRGITFVFSVDGEVLLMSRTDPVQGFMATQVMGAEVRGKKELIIEVTSTHPSFPIEAAHFTSLRLIAPDGNIVVLDDHLDGGRAPATQLQLTRQQIHKLLSADVRQWPVQVETKSGQLGLLPMKDVPNLARPEGGVGHSAPIADSSFCVLVPVKK